MKPEFALCHKRCNVSLCAAEGRGLAPMPKAMSPHNAADLITFMPADRLSDDAEGLWTIDHGE